MIRTIKNNEIMLLTDFLYEAIFQEDQAIMVPRTILQEPDVWKYLDEFGSKQDDHCLVAEEDGKIIGAVWVRCIKAYGYYNDAVPELAISMYPQYRGKGIGTSLMKAMIQQLQSKGYAQVSLAVQKANRASTLYQRLGFTIVGENEQEYCMVYDLKEVK